MYTTHVRYTDKAAAYKDREYWFKQGCSVGILFPGDGDKWYTVYVHLTFEVRDTQ
jgi:hypothetical protein